MDVGRRTFTSYHSINKALRQVHAINLGLRAHENMHVHERRKHTQAGLLGVRHKCNSDDTGHPCGRLRHTLAGSVYA